MTDQTPAAPADERCVACDIVWNILIVAGAATVALIFIDTVTGGKVTEVLTRTFHQVRPKLAAVIPLRPEENTSDSDAG